MSIYEGSTVSVVSGSIPVKKWRCELAMALCPQLAKKEVG
jgi:hypothetical protein